jgi:hypothetical protein
MLGQGGRTGRRSLAPMHRIHPLCADPARLTSRLTSRLMTRLTACLLGMALAASAAAAPERSAALLAEHASLQTALRDSPFGEPVLLRQTDAGAQHSGEVMALLPRPLAAVAAALRTADSLCGLLILQLNVRDCQAVAGAPAQQLQLSAGPLRAALPGLVVGMRLQLLLEADTPGYFSVSLLAPVGPLGSSDLRLRVEAVALDADQTYLHVSYSQTSGLAGRLASRLYLATAGRDKIGFSSDGLDALGQPRPVSGERAAVERQVMRHHLGLLAHSGVLAGPPAARLEARLRAWHALTERHAAQLHELDLAEYLAEKRAATAALR